MLIIKRKARNKGTAPKAVTEYFSVRGAWDVLVIILLLGIVVYFSYYVRNNHVWISVWPQIRQVKIDGNVRPADHEAFKEIVVANVAKGFFHIPMDQLEQELTELPWVHHAKVRRIWPNTLAIRVHEQNPIARWGKAGLMNAYGEPFFPESIEPYTALPMLYGEETRAKELAGIFENSLRRLEPLGLQLQGLFENERQSKHLVLSNGMILVIGNGNVGRKIKWFITAYEQYLSSHIRQVKKIDLRYTNGLAVEWKDPQLAGNFELERNL